MGNIERLREAMASEGTPALLVSEINNVKWLSGFSGSSAMVLITPNEARFLTDSRYTLQAKEEVQGMESYTFASPVEMTDFIAQHAREMGISKLGFESTYVTYSAFEKWKAALAGIELVPTPDIFDGLRMVKTPEEVGRIRAACGLADACFTHVIRMIQPGVSEWDVALDIEFFFRRSGAELAFPPIVVSGERSARPHGKPSEKKLEVGDFLTMDFGAKVDGYCSDITRTVVVGKAEDRHREVYGQVLEAQLAVLDAMKPGALAKEIDALSREILDRKDLAKYFGHGLGHGLGSVVHDSGRLSPSSTAVLAPGQVWTVEPGVYIPGFGGVRIEDDVVVTETGVDILTRSTKELLVLPA